MFSDVVIFSLVYTLFCVCIVVPPTECVSAGLTLNNLFSYFIESEDMRFVRHHLGRTILTITAHSLLPFGYFFGLCWIVEATSIEKLWEDGIMWKLAICTSLLLPTIAGFIVAHWYVGNWEAHPLTRVLRQYDASWTSVAAAIETEFRRVDKFISGIGTLTKTIVTDSWIIKVTPYKLHIIHQSDATLMIVGSEEHAISHVSSTGVQYLSIKVESRRPGISSFFIRLNSMEYSDLREKLKAPIQNARNIVVHQSLSDRFVEEFRRQVTQNPRYPVNSNLEVEHCIGCMQTLANVKLQKLCNDPTEGECQHCYCRPMWCLDCMGKWFASRQDQAHPETWLSSRCPCPTCRSIFCMLDVCILAE